jgi:hypothetical protein
VPDGVDVELVFDLQQDPQNAAAPTSNAITTVPPKQGRGEIAFGEPRLRFINAI